MRGRPKEGIPANFKEIVESRNMAIVEIKKEFHIGTKKAYIWCEETGAKYRSNACLKHAMPASFPDDARVMSSEALKKKYGVSGNVIARWRKECGVPSPKLFQPSPNKPRVGQNMMARMGQPTKTAFTSHVPLDGSVAAQAAQYLRASWGGRLPMVALVEYTDLKNHYPKGMYAVSRRGNKRGVEVMTAADMIALAEEKGFNPVRLGVAA